MSIRSRVLKVGAVKLVEIFLLTATKLVTVPVFLKFWSMALYGEWLVLYTALGYFALGNPGLAQAAANDMTILVARNDRKSAVAVYQTALVAITTISILLILLGALISYSLPLTRWLNLDAISADQVAPILLSFIGYVVLGFLLQLFVSGYRCEGLYHQGLLIWLGGTCLEFVATIIALVLGAKPVALALSLLVARLLTTGTMFVALSRAVPWLRFGKETANMKDLRRIISPSLSFAAFPAGTAVLNQGIIIIIAATLGPVSVVVFTTLKTITNLGTRTYELVNQAIYPEVSFAWGQRDTRTVRSIHRLSWQLSSWAGLVSCLVILLCASPVYARWTGNKVPFDFTELAILTAVLFVRAFWSTSYVIPSAINTHQRITVLYLTASISSLLLAIALGLIHPTLYSLTLTLLLLELVMTLITVPQALVITQDHLFPFLRAVIAPPNPGRLRNLFAARGL